MAKARRGKGSGRPRTKEESAAQKVRTAKNQIKRYTSLLAERPNHAHAKVWKNRVEKYEAVLH